MQRRFDEVHALDLLEFALRLRSFAGLGSEAICKVLQAVDLTLLVLVGCGVLFVARYFFHEEIIVVPAVAIQPCARDLDDPADELIQEIPVVRNHHDRAGIIAEMLAKPDERFEIEMVCRLVEQQQIRLLREKPCEMRPHDPPAAEPPRRPIEVPLAKSQTGENALRFRGDRVAVVLGKLGERFVVFV